jgi:hypothetical protein
MEATMANGKFPPSHRTQREFEEIRRKVSEQRVKVMDKLSSLYPEQLIQVARFIEETSVLTQPGENRRSLVNTYEDAVVWLTWYFVKSEEVRHDVVEMCEKQETAVDEIIAATLMHDIPPGNAA